MLLEKNSLPIVIIIEHLIDYLTITSVVLFNNSTLSLSEIQGLDSNV